MQVLFLKTDKTKDVKGRKKFQFACFLCYSLARMEWKIERFCKMKTIILT